MIARAGVTALNFLAPGLGLIRIGHWREGLKIAAAYQLPLWLLGAAAFVLPIPGFVAVVVATTLFCLTSMAALIFGFARTWRASRHTFSQRWWSRWYALFFGLLPAWC